MTIKILSPHAHEEIKRRGIPDEFVNKVLSEPEQIVDEHSGRKAYQSRFPFSGGKIFLVRAIVEERSDPPVVVTVYRTSKIEKYWRDE
jgi:hypothetical protein